MRSLVVFLMCFIVIVQTIHAQADDLTAILETYVAEDDPGVVLLVDTEDDTLTAVRGLADLENGTPMQLSDRFRIASVSKPFVAVLTLLLVEEELIELDAPIADYLPAEIIAGIENGDTVTVRQLLQMTSGIYNYTESDAYYDTVFADPETAWTAADTVALVEGQPAYFAPGEGYYYSNTNYTLAQLVIESVTGVGLGENLKTRIFDPLGMSSTFLENNATIGEGLAQGYTDWDGDGTLDNVTRVNDGIGLGDGGIVSTAEDLVLFVRGLFEGDLLSEDSSAELTHFIDDGEGGWYGLGLEWVETDTGEWMGHSGLSSGFQSMMYYSEEESAVVIALTNSTDVEYLYDIAVEAAEAVLGE